MASFDTRLVAPPPGQLVACLVEAFARANEGLHLLQAAPEHWEEFVARLGGLAQGRRQWSDTHHGETARVSLAWWTDHVGRRHFRIVGGNSRDGSYRTLASTRTDPRPPLWHVYPDRLFYRERNGGGAWRAVCDCGLCGPPAALAWMGTSCGPCHDRRQEGLFPPRTVCTEQFRHLGPPGAVAFSPDGQTLAVLPESPSPAVRLHDLATGEGADLIAPRRPIQRLVFSPDGRLLAAACSYEGLWLVDRDAGEVVLDVVEPTLPIECLAFSADGLALAAGGAAGVRVWKRQSLEGTWHLRVLSARPVASLAFAPGGDVLALGCNNLNAEGTGNEAPLVLLDLRDGEESLPGGWTEFRYSTVRDVGFTAHGEIVALGAMGYRGLLTLEELQLHVVRRGGLRLFQLNNPAIAVFDRSMGGYRLMRNFSQSQGRVETALSPGAQWAAALSPGSNRVTVVEAVSGQEVGVIGWDLLRQAVGAVFSPDAQTLAVLDEEHVVKLVPWRLLLEA